MKLGWQHFIDNFAFWRPIHQCLKLYFMKWAVSVTPDLGCEHNVVIMSCWEVYCTMVSKGIAAIWCNTHITYFCFLTICEVYILSGALIFWTAGQIGDLYIVQQTWQKSNCWIRSWLYFYNNKIIPLIFVSEREHTWTETC